METSKNNTKTVAKLMDPVVCYPGHIAKCAQVSNTARNVLDVILIIMSPANQIIMDESVIYQIRRIAKDNIGKEYAAQTIKNTISE